MAEYEREFSGGASRALSMILYGHSALHRMEEDGPDSPVTLASLTERELLLVGMALPGLEILLLQIGVACEEINELSHILQRKLMDFTRTQHPEWTVSGELNDEPESSTEGRSV